MIRGLAFQGVGTPASLQRVRRRVAVVPGGGSYPEPPDGYDIILLGGDSRMHGLASANTAYNRTGDMAEVDGTYQFTGPDAALNGETAGVISPDVTPTWANNGTSDGGIDRVNPAEHIVRLYHQQNPVHLLNGNRRTLVVNMGNGGSKTTNGANAPQPGEWSIGEDLYEEWVSHSISAVNTAIAQFPGSRVVGAGLSIGSNDANSTNTLDGSVYQTLYGAMIDDFRARVPTASESWFMIWNLVPGLGGTDATSVRTAHANLASAKANTFIAAPTGGGADNLHEYPSQSLAGIINAMPTINAMPEPQKVRAFAIPAQTDVAPSTSIRSAPVMVNIGYGRVATLAADQPFSVNGGAFNTSPKTVYWGDTFEIERPSSATAGATVNATATITGPLGVSDAKSATFSVTTGSAGSNDFIMRGTDEPGFVISNGSIVPATGGSFKEVS